jgi:hypothetical protein
MLDNRCNTQDFYVQTSFLIINFINHCTSLNTKYRILNTIPDKNTKTQIPKQDPQNASIIQPFLSFHNALSGQNAQVWF